MRTLIADPDLLDAMVARLQSGPVHDSGWRQDFVEPASGIVWQVTRLLGELQGGGYRCLVRLPAPTPPDLLVLVSESEAADEIWAAAVLLRDHPEHYPELLEVLEGAAERAEWARVLLGTRWTGITSGANRRMQIGQSVDQITRDATHFADLAARAATLAQRAESGRHPDQRRSADRVRCPWAAV